MSEKLYLYPGVIRIWHLLNAILIILLIITGLSMQYADPSQPFVSFKTAVNVHNLSGFLLAFNYMFFIISNTISKNGKYYRITLKGFMGRIIKQANYYTFGVFKGEKAPFPVTKKQKFNPIQQFTYFMTMYVFMPLVIVSGALMLFSGAIVRQLLGNSAFFWTDMLHIVIGFLISVFLVIHIYFCTMGAKPTSSFKSMVTGYHEGDH